MAYSDLRAMTMREMLEWVEVTSEIVRTENGGNEEGDR